MKQTVKSAKSSSILFRSETDKMLGGVAGGIAAYFEVDANLVRFMFVLITLLGGSGILLYLILWILLPSESTSYRKGKDTIKENVGEIKGMARQMANEIKPKTKKAFSHEWLAIILIIIGVLFLLNNFGLLWWISMNKIWPIILILLGIAVIARNDKR